MHRVPKGLGDHGGPLAFTWLGLWRCWRLLQALALGGQTLPSATPQATHPLSLVAPPLSRWAWGSPPLCLTWTQETAP